MLGNHKGCLYIGSISVGDLYGLKIAIAFLIQSLELLSHTSDSILCFSSGAVLMGFCDELCSVGVAPTIRIGYLD